MLKNKRILLIIIFAIALFLIPNMCNAADTFTTSDGIVVKKVVTGFSNGNIELNVSNIELSSEGNYTWGIGKSSSADNITNWYVLGDINSSKKTASLNLTVQDKNILALLRATNTAYLFIKDTSDDTLVIDGLQVDLTLPPLYAFDIITEKYNSWYIIGGDLTVVDRWNGATYNISTAYYKFEKITDETLIANYKQALLDGTSLTEVFSIDTSTVEAVENWTACTRDYSYAYTKIDESKIPTDQGAYYLWIKAKDADSKTVYGCLIVNIDADGPVVEKIRVSSPNSGTYATGQTVKINVEFSEAIKGSTVPTLKIKFGDSVVRTISNGTIINNGNYTHYIQYSYNIQESDKGQLATVELTGGNIKDSSDNNAKLSCPIITGNTIKANVEGTNNNQTDNLDKENNNQTQTPDTTVTLSSIAITKTPTRNTYSEGEKFDKSGMVITATYSDGSTKQITNYSVSPLAELKVGDTQVVITYTENGVTKTAEQTISVAKDTTTKGDNKLPQTGASLLILAVISFIVVAVISKVKYGTYKDI